jgi:hypothetical protein
MNGEALEIGGLVVDTDSGRRGVLMAWTAGTAWLRPAGGGLEWTARAIRSATAAEALSAAVAAANARSRGAL